MNEGPVTVRYAKALFNSAEEQKVSDQVYADCGMIGQVLRENDDLKNFLESPVITPTQKNKVLSVTFKDHCSSLTLSLFQLIIDNKREKFLEGIVRMFIQFYRDRKNIRTIEFITARGISNNLRTQVLKRVKEVYVAEIELTEKTDERIIGGFVIRVEDMQYDASVAYQLNKIQQELLDTTVKNIN